MRQRIALALLFVTAAAACGEAPTGPRSDLRAVGASKDVTVGGGGTYGSGGKDGVTTSAGASAGVTIASDSTGASGDDRGGMFGSGH